MNRRSFLAASAGLLTASAAGQTAKRKPNIVLIVLDDLGSGDLGCYGQKHILTPNIDRVAAGGMRFGNAYAGAAVCAPSRAVLMTGLHAGHAPVRANAGTIPIADQDVTLAEVLKQAGYATGGFGKWGLGDARTSGAPTRQGFDEFFGYLHQVHAHTYYPDFLWDGDQKHDLPKGTYSADLIAQKTLDFIRARRERPFFAYACWTLPHARFEAPDVDPYADKSWPTGHKTYASMVSRADRHVGKVVDVLRELNLERDTVLIITSDNGAHKGEEKGFDFFRSNGALRGEKGELYEGGIRVPFIVRWPGHVAGGSTSAHVTAFCDVLPTLAEITGASAPSGLDGISIVNALTGRKQRQHEYLYWEHNTYDQKAGRLRDQRRWQAVRMGDWKAVRVAPASPVELYNLRSDQAEQTDLAGTKPDLVRRAEELMKEARTEPRPHNTGSPKFVS
jgi:arylsulfatase A-like enzyme